MFTSNQITAEKSLVNATTSTSSIGLAEFQTLICTSVLQDLDTQIGMHKSEIEAASAEKKALSKDISILNSKIASPEIIDVKGGKSKETKSFESIKLTNAEYKELENYAKKMGLTAELSKNVNLAEKFAKAEFSESDFKTKVSDKLSSLKNANNKALLTTAQIKTLATKYNSNFEKSLNSISLTESQKESIRKAYLQVRAESKIDADKNNQYVSPDFLKTFKEHLENKLTDLNSQTETDAIRFQALMDARKQNLLMLSNMISSDHQTKMSIINNMKS